MLWTPPPGRNCGTVARRSPRLFMAAACQAAAPRYILRPTMALCMLSDSTSNTNQVGLKPLMPAFRGADTRVCRVDTRVDAWRLVMLIAAVLAFTATAHAQLPDGPGKPET